MNASISHTVDHLREALALVGRAHPEIVRVVLFGSAARGDDTAESDVDLAVSFTPEGIPRGLAGFAFLDHLEKEFTARLGRSVHLIEHEAVENARRIGNHSLPRAMERDGRLVYDVEPAAD